MKKDEQKQIKSAKVRKFHLSAKDREYLTTNLGLLLKAAVPVGEALESMAAATSSRTFRQATQQMIRDVDDGLPLWQALERSGAVPAQTLALLRLGEESGNMVANLQVAARQEAKQLVFRSKVRSALLYPLFVISLTGTVGLGIAWFLLPRLSETLLGLNVPLPLISRIFLAIGNFMQHYGIYAVPGALIVGILLLYVVFAAPKTKIIGSWLLFHTPGVSRLLYEVEVARFGYLLGTLLDAGLSITRSLELLEQATSVQAYQKLYRYLHQSCDDGYSFKQALARYPQAHKLLPPSVQQLIVAGERSGALSETLKLVGQSYEEKADISTNNLEVILEPLLLVIVASGVLCVAIAVILPIYKLTSGLSN